MSERHGQPVDQASLVALDPTAYADADLWIGLSTPMHEWLAKHRCSCETVCVCDNV